MGIKYEGRTVVFRFTEISLIVYSYGTKVETKVKNIMDFDFWN